MRHISASGADWHGVRGMARRATFRAGGIFLELLLKHCFFKANLNT